MNAGSGRTWFRSVGIPAISSLAVLLIAAGADLEQNWSRLRALPMEQRKVLIENLRRFDLVLTTERQKSLAELDRRLQSLEPGQRSQYMAALHRYHIWLGQLPENLRDNINAAAPSERMALVRKALADNHPVPRVDTSMYLRHADPGEFSPFELAAVYKIWQNMKPDQRQTVEKMARGGGRVERIFSFDKGKEIGRELKPEDFDEAHWLERLETDFKAARPWLLLEDLKKKEDKRRVPILRRLAINYYFTKQKITPVVPERLDAFVAAFPSFIRESFERLPPDEARRRVSVIYRLVYPPGHEMTIIPATAPGPAPAPAGRADAGKPSGTPVPPVANPPRTTF
jgi:hypothetical protein